MLISILTLLLLNYAPAADLNTFTIINIKPYDDIQSRAFNSELGTYTDQCGDHSVEQSIDNEHNLALLDVAGNVLSINCNYCRNGIYLYKNNDNKNEVAEFYTLTPPDGKFGSHLAVLDCIEKIKFIKNNVNNEKLSIKITIDKYSSTLNFEGPKSVWAGVTKSIEAGSKIINDLKFDFLKNKISEYQQKYPNIYFEPNYSIPQNYADEMRSTLDLIQDYRNNLNNEKQTYKDWYFKKNNKGKTTADFLINLSASVNTQSMSYYDQEIASYSGLPLPLLTTSQDQNMLIEKKPMLTEYADNGSLEKSTGLLAACSKIVDDGEHILDGVMIGLRKYLREDKPSESYIRKVNLSLEEKTSDLFIIDKMTKDTSEVQLKNIFFSLLSNKYKFNSPVIYPTDKNLIDKIIPAESSEIKQRINDTFKQSSVLKALSDANEEYKKLVTNNDTKHLFEHSQNIKQDLTNDFNSEIQRMNTTCKVVNKLYSDLQTGTYNPDLEEVRKSVEEKFKTELTPMAVVINEDGTWQSGQQYNFNKQQEDKENRREKIKKYIGEARYNELYNIAYGLSKKTIFIKSLTEELPYSDDPEYKLDKLLYNELQTKLETISNKIEKERKNSTTQMRLPTDEEWEITELLSPKDNYLNLSLNQKMVNKEIVQRLKKVTQELVQQSSYKLANTKFVHLLLVEDFRKTLRMNGTGDIIQDRCLDGDGQLFNEAKVTDVKKAIKGYEELSLGAAKDMLEKLEKIQRIDDLGKQNKYVINSYSSKIDFIKDSLKTSPLVIADLLRTKHDFRYEELLCLYVKEINTTAENTQLARKALFWTGVTVSLAATVISGGSLGFTVPAALATGIGNVAMATDILFVTSEGFEAWRLYNLKEDTRKNNSAYYEDVQNTLMRVDLLNVQKNEAIQSAVIMAVIGSVGPSIGAVKNFFKSGTKTIETLAEDGTMIKEEIKTPYLDKKTGYITTGKSVTLKTPEELNKEVVKITKANKTIEGADYYKRNTVWENTPEGTVRNKTKTFVKKEFVEKEVSSLSDESVVPKEIKRQTFYRNNETVPTTLKETVVKKIKPLENGVEVETITKVEEQTSFTPEQILETNKNKLAAKKLKLEEYKSGKIYLNADELAKLQRDIDTLESKIKSLLEKNELSRLTIKNKEITPDGNVVTEHKVISTFKSARYKFENPSEELVESSTASMRSKLARIGIKGERAEGLVKRLGNQAAKFTNFLEQTRICRAMTKDNIKFSQYAQATMFKLASSKFLAGGSTSLFMYWKDNHNWGEINSDIGGDVVGQFAKAFGGAGVSTIPLIGKKGNDGSSIYQTSPNYEVYKQNIKQSIVTQDRFGTRFKKAFPRSAGWSMLTKVISGAVYYEFGGATEEYGDDALYASGVRLGYGIAWAVPSTALEVTLYDFIIGATCVIPGGKVFATVSDNQIKAINFATATSIQFMYPLLTNWIYYWGRGATYDAFGLKKKTQEIDAETSKIATLDFNMEYVGDAKAELITLDKYNRDKISGNIDKNKTYVIEIQSPENFD